MFLMQLKHEMDVYEPRNKTKTESKCKIQMNTSNYMSHIFVIAANIFHKGKRKMTY